MTTRRNHLLLSALVIALCSALPRPAHAAWGCITGYLKFWNNQGNYCPSSRSCVDALYPEGEHWHDLPLRDTKLVLIDTSGNAITTGVTDTNGYFELHWFYGSGEPTSGYLQWWLGHKDDRFHVANHDGAWFYAQSQMLTLPTFPFEFMCTSPSAVNPWTFWPGGNPLPHANIYDGAWRTWNNSFQWVGYLQANFMDVAIRYHSVGDECPHSCANGLDVLLDGDATTPYAYSARIAHELGHVASDQVSHDREAVSV